MLNDKIFYTNIDNEIYQVKIELAYIGFPIGTYELNHGIMEPVCLIANIASLGRFIWREYIGWEKEDTHEKPKFHLIIYKSANSAEKGEYDANSNDYIFFQNKFYVKNINDWSADNFLNTLDNSIPKGHLFLANNCGYFRNRIAVEGYYWDGVKPILTHPYTPKSYLVQYNSYHHLCYDIVAENFIYDEDISTYYESEDECRKNNSVKIHCF